MRSAKSTFAFFPLLLAFLLVFSGCTRNPPDDSEVSTTLTGGLRTPIQIQWDNYVRRQPPAIYVAPQSPGYKRLKAIFVPLRSRQQIANAVSFNERLSRQVWQIWLSLNAFTVLEFAPEAGPYRPESAVAYARRRGADLVIGGYINHFIDGGEGGDSSISLEIDIHDAKTGTQLWAMAQEGMMSARQAHDFYLFEISERNPQDPTGFIARSLAWDMGRVVLGWVDPSAAQPKGGGGLFESSAF